jgi:hypothetical protein
MRFFGDGRYELVAEADEFGIMSGVIERVRVD